MRLRISLRGYVRPSVCSSNDEYDRLSKDIMINDSMSDDGVVASDEPPRYLFSSESRRRFTTSFLANNAI